MRRALVLAAVVTSLLVPAERMRPGPYPSRRRRIRLDSAIG